MRKRTSNLSYKSHQYQQCCSIINHSGTRAGEVSIRERKKERKEKTQEREGKKSLGCQERLKPETGQTV